MRGTFTAPKSLWEKFGYLFVQMLELEDESVETEEDTVIVNGVSIHFPQEGHYLVRFDYEKLDEDDPIGIRLRLLGTDRINF